MQKRFGLSFNVSDEDELAAQIKRILTDDRLVRDMSERAHAGARELAPNADEWCDNLLRLYQEKLHRPQRGCPASASELR